MPITASDAISGSVYVVASSAESAQREALAYLSSGEEKRNVFDHKAEAAEFLRDPFRARPPVLERVYTVSLDIRVTEK